MLVTVLQGLALTQSSSSRAQTKARYDTARLLHVMAIIIRTIKVTVTTVSTASRLRSSQPRAIDPRKKTQQQKRIL